MAYRFFGGGSAEVANDQSGNVAGGVDFTVWDSDVGGTKITDLLDGSGAALPGQVTSVTPEQADVPQDVGRIFFQAPAAYSVLYLDRGYGKRWAIMAREIGSLVGTAIDRANYAYNGVQDIINARVATYSVAAYGPDDTAAIRGAVADAVAGGGGTVSFEPDKAYDLTGVVELGSNITLEGNGAVLVNRQPSGAFRAFAVKSNGATGYGSGARNIRWRNLTIRGDFTSTTNRGGQAMNANHLSDFVAEGCRFEQLGNTSHIFDLGGCEDITYRDCTFAGCLDVDNNEAIQLDCSTLGGMVIDDPAGYDGLPTRRVTLDNCRAVPITVDGTTYPAPHLIGSHYAPPSGVFYEDITVRGGYVLDPLLDAPSVVAPGALHFVGVSGLLVDGLTYVVTDPGAAPRAVGVYAKAADGGGTSRPRDINITNVTLVGASTDQPQIYLAGADNVRVDVAGRGVGAGASAAVALADVDGFRVTADLTAGSGTHSAGVSIGAGCANGSADVRATGFTKPTAVTAGLSAVTVPDQAAHVIGAAGEPPFQNSWAGYSGQTITYQMLPSGKVSVSGLVAGGARATTVFTLPEGYRPPATKNLPVLIKADTGIAGKLTVGASGNLAFAADDFNGTGTIVWAGVDVEFWPAP